MKPRILFLVDRQDQDYLKAYMDSDVFESVPYSSPLGKDAVADFLKTNSGKFDGIVVFDTPGYAQAREALKESKHKRTILLHFIGDPPQDEGYYPLTVDLKEVLPSQFDEHIRNTFRELNR